MEPRDRNMLFPSTLQTKRWIASSRCSQRKRSAFVAGNDRVRYKRMPANARTRPSLRAQRSNPASNAMLDCFWVTDAQMTPCSERAASSPSARDRQELDALHKRRIRRNAVDAQGVCLAPFCIQIGGRSRACRGTWSPHFAAATPDDIKRNEAAFSSHEIAIRQRGTPLPRFVVRAARKST